MEKKDRSNWLDKAVKYRNMRYPNYNLRVSHHYKYDTPVNTITLETFVRKGDRLMYVSDSYIYSGQFEIGMLRTCLEKFNENCIKVFKDGIFNTKTTIKEPKKKSIDLNNFNTFKK